MEERKYILVGGILVFIPIIFALIMKWLSSVPFDFSNTAF